MRHGSILTTIFHGHEDVLSDLNLRVTETTMTPADFIEPDTDQTLPIITNSRQRWNKIRPSVIKALCNLNQSVVGDEVTSLLNKYNFRVAECSTPTTKKRTNKQQTTSESASMQGRMAQNVVPRTESFVNPNNCPKCGSTSTIALSPKARQCQSCGLEFEKGRPEPRPDFQRQTTRSESSGSALRSAPASSVTRNESFDPIEQLIDKQMSEATTMSGTCRQCQTKGPLFTEDKICKSCLEDNQAHADRVSKNPKGPMTRVANESSESTPPNLRQASGPGRCSGCKYFDPQESHCEMYNDFPVKPDQTCDEFVAGTPGSMEDDHDDKVESLIDQYERTGLVIVNMTEKAPPGFEGTVRAMKGHKDIDNPYALAWSMKNKGYKSHRNADGSKKDESVCIMCSQIHPLDEETFLCHECSRLSGIQFESRLTDAAHGASGPVAKCSTCGSMNPVATSAASPANKPWTCGNCGQRHKAPEGENQWRDHVGIPIQSESRLAEMSDEDHFQSGDRVRLRPNYAGREAGEVFTVGSQGSRPGKFWIGDKQGRGWYASGHQVMHHKKCATCARSTNESVTEDQEWYQAKKLGSGDYDWSHGQGRPTAAGRSVRVNAPGHPMHGQTGRIIRQQANQFAVENPSRPGSVEYFGSHQLESIDYMGHKFGSSVRINKPGHPSHGQVGVVQGPHADDPNDMTVRMPDKYNVKLPDGTSEPFHVDNIHRVTESMSRDCHIFKASNGKHYMHLAHEEYGDLDDSTAYGPFNSFDETYEYLRDQHSNPGSHTYDESGKVAPPTKSLNGGRLVSPRKGRWGTWTESSNNDIPTGHHTEQGIDVPHASFTLQEFHRHLGAVLPELHALVTSTLTDERAALSMLFNELNTAHADMGNILTYSNQIPDIQMQDIASHYSLVVSEMLAALNPLMDKNPSVGIGPYKFGGSLND